ncbi:hypothetical protein B0H19DRAFT_1275578 [Mycena capillaripes]|nr:hypothetical protein B0H19DRAFT_1275578 [Mycena capillaripes]
MNTHKESFELVVRYLLSEPLGIHVKDVWCIGVFPGQAIPFHFTPQTDTLGIECPNHGSSAAKNRVLLETPAYRDSWTAMEYCRAAHAFLTSTTHGIDFRKRSLVGLAQSAGSAPLLMLQRVHPLVKFQGLVFMDAAIFPVEKIKHVDKSSCGTGRVIQEGIRKMGSFLGGVRYALRLDDTATKVTLRCSTKQEAAYFLSPNADLVEPPTEIFLEIVKEDKLPIHIIICLNDEYPEIGKEMKQFQISKVQRMSRGSVQIVEGGHMFPQTEPSICASAIFHALQRIELSIEPAATSVVGNKPASVRVIASAEEEVGNRRSNGSVASDSGLATSHLLPSYGHVTSFASYELEDLPRDVVFNTSAVSTLFRAISLPLLFKELVITPYGYSDTPSAQEQVLERLEFLSSEEIAAYIVHCTVHIRGTDPSIVSMNSTDLLMAETFKTIPRFTKMRHLSFSFDPFFIIDLSRLGLELLPHLERLTIRNPDILCSLAVDFPRFARSEWLMEASDQLHTFHNLHSLSITCPFLMRIRNHGLIARFPALRNLTITGKSGGQNHAVDTPPCPLLGHFTGPCAYLPLVLPGTSCTHLTLLPCGPDELLHALRRMGQAPSITNLTLLLSHAQLFHWTSCQEVFDRLPAVVDLQLEIIAEGDTNSTEAQLYTTESLLQLFVEFLRAPDALERATIRWSPGDQIMCLLHGLDSALSSAIPKLRNLRMETGSRS